MRKRLHKGTFNSYDSGVARTSAAGEGMESPIPEAAGRDDDLAARLSKLYTAAIVDVLERHGEHHACLPSAVAALVPEARVAGPAYPYTYVPSTSRDRDVVHNATLVAYNAAPTGSVFVCAPTPFDHAETGNFGELGHMMNRGNQIRGFVIDGGIRDAASLVKAGIGVFCRYRSPRPLLGRWEIGTYGEPIEIGDVRIRPGDWLVGDWDGVVCVPHEIVEEIVEEAEAYAAMEESWRAAVESAENPIAAYRALEGEYQHTRH